MNDETLTNEKSKDGSLKGDGRPSVQQILTSGRYSLKDEGRPIVVASTFTADLIVQPLTFWMATLEIAADISMAPYAQVMQELLNRESLLSQNRTGFNVLLIRLEDWIRDRQEESVEHNVEHIRRTATDFVTAMGALRRRTSAPALVFCCPSSSSLPPLYATALEQIQSDLISRLKNFVDVHCWSHEDLIRVYPVDGYEDPRADRIGHIPFTNEYFIALATALVRRIATLVKPPYKVIVIDCDNTLWKGVCGEDGAAGVGLTPAHLELQRMLVRQNDAGMLLCICSKNNESDVEAVFRTRHEMLLRQEHIVCSRINWNSKSSNIRSISEELDLSLDSFIILDDSAMECAEVKSNCPSVLTLQVPASSDEIIHFLDHVWAFDRIGVTEEAKVRTAQYRQNRVRANALKDAASLENFIESLEVDVVVAEMQREQLPRVAELIQRTNQFNLTTIRRSSSEIATLCNSGDIECLVVHVRDRFGDYGLVGALFLRREASCIDVDTFVLSCRVLGRGVEYRVVNELGRIAEREGRAGIVLRYRPTSRNAPAQEFLDRSFKQFRAEAVGQSAVEARFTVPVKYAATVGSEPAIGRQNTGEDTSFGYASTQQSTSYNSRWHEAAYRLSRVADVIQEINRSASRSRSEAIEYIAPRNPIEAAVADIWADVLSVAEVSVRHDFFDLGGNSLLAVQVITRIASVLGLELSIFEFFAGPTVADVALRLSSAAQSNVQIERVDRGGPVSLSWAQQRLWFIDQLEGGSTAYHVPLAARMHGELNRAALQGALDGLVARHEALRTVFIQVNGVPLQKLAPDARFSLQLRDLRALEVQEREAEVLRQSREELLTPFDLSGGPLIRGRLLWLLEDEHFILITMHHIVSDGWSIGVLIRELGVLYEAYRDERPDPLPSLPIQYADYALWQRESQTEPDRQKQLKYWTEHLQGVPELLELPTDRRRPATKSYRGANAPVSLGTSLTEELKSLSRRINMTPVMILHAAWSIVLHRLSGQEDVVVGIPVANRQRTELEGLIGFFVNTLAVRVRLENDPSVTDLLQRVKEIMLGAYAHQDAPFEKVVEVLQPARSLSHSPLFQVMFVFQNTPRSVMSLAGLTLVEQEVSVQTAQFDLTLSLHERASEIAGSLNYATDLFDSDTIERWVGCFTSVLQAMVQAPHLRVSRVPLMAEGERRQVIDLFNAAHSTAYPQEQLIHKVFEAQVESTPDSVAVVYERQSLTYAELNIKANQLAWYLRGKGVGPDQLVALCVERGMEMVIALLGILKAGGAYVPLDPDYPADRLAYMLNDAAPRVLLIQKRLRVSLPHTLAEVIELDDDWSDIAKSYTGNLNCRQLGLSPRHLAYVIYTSGSTGNPKGVMIEHRNVTRLFAATEEWFSFNARDVWTLFHSFAFDFSVWELWGALLYGGRVVVVPYGTSRSPEEFYRLLCAEGVTVLNQTPSAFSQLIDVCARSADTRHSLRVVIFGGEALDVRALRPWMVSNGANKPQLVNMYGITETTVHVTYRRITEEDIELGYGSPIGNAIPDLYEYLLDRHMQPVPIGVTGELYVGGAGVARGYLNRPELTAERFLPNPFRADSRARVYKTGDLGLWHKDGTVEYLGRNDHQVKIRGFRIELGEIEAQLTRHERVRDAVVIIREDVPGEKRLVAYLLPSELSDATGPSAEVMRAHLKAVLPEYMIPSAFVMIERMPLTPNGKCDPRALPAPDLEAYASRRYEAPQGEVEEILAGIWQVLLRVDRIGRQDNFFELGGHSLLVVQMMERLRRLSLSADVRRVFETPTLADLAAALTLETVGQFEVPVNAIPAGCEVITPEMLPLVELEVEHIERIVQSVPSGAPNIQDIYPLAPLQEGILFHHLLNERGADTYVVPTLLALSSRRRLEDLITALQTVIDRHDVLRTAILWEQLPRPLQVVYRHAPLPVDEVVLDADRDPTEQINEWLKPKYQRLNLRRAPLIRLRVAADLKSEQWYALLQQHHIVSDNTSQEIVISELLAELEGQAQRLPDSVPYRNHVAQALAYARKYDADAFFRSKLGEIDEPTAPFGLFDVHGDGTQIEEARLDLDAVLAQRIRTQARRLGVSAATLFHAAAALVIAHTSGRNNVVFGSVLLGRLQGTAGAQRVLGMFINTLPLRLRLQDQTAKKLVEQVQREIVELLNHEQSSLAAAQRCSSITGSAPLFNTLLNYRHSARTSDAEWIRTDGIRVLETHAFTNYPITLSVDDFGEGFTLTAQTDRRVDPHRMSGYLCTAVQSLVEALDQAPQRQALSLTILPASERREIVELFNATEAAYERETLVHELFERQMQSTPDEVALVHGERSLTYTELNAKANQLARYLRSKGIGPDHLVGVCVERSFDMVIGLLGILKAGGAYVPLDPNYPIERLQYMLSDAAPRAVLTQERMRKVLPSTTRDLIDFDGAFNEISSNDEDNLTATEQGVPDLVYVIYTSGSTGRPKGTVMPHRAMVNLIEWHRQSLGIRIGQRVLQYAALSFDVAFQEIFSTLCTGGTLVLLDEWLRRDPQALTELLSVQSIERLFVPPMMLQSLSECFARGGGCPRSLKDVITAGEQLRISPEIVDFFQHVDGCRLHNHYGPTETHVVTALTLPGDTEEWSTFPTIGRPISNARIYILDRLRQPVPIGVTGEIYIGGASVAVGYLNQPGLTGERFLCDHFSTDLQSRLYRTGDLGRWRADGSIEYLGRNDDQVKIRGFRIELGEVEAQLARHPEVREASIVAREDVPGEKRLVAYITKHDQSSLYVEELRAYMKGVLPEYMVPSAFVSLESMPLTPSGKLDRRALPAPELGAYASQQYDAPQGEVEQGLVRIWQELLQVERVGRQDDFFEMGGHSLLVLKALSKINQSFGTALSVTDVYRSPTIRELATRIGGEATIDDGLVDLSREAALEDEIVAQPGRNRVPAEAVLLTGGTGFVGRFLLAQLLQDTDATIHCLVRASSQHQAMSRVRGTLEKWDLWRDEFEPRIVVIPGDLRLPRLGIEERTYQALSQKIDSIYHCGTSMNHLETYAMAKPANVGSAKELLRFATNQRPKLVNYISTLGVFSSISVGATRVVVEASPIDHEKHLTSNGYVASKWVGERIFMTAGERGIRCNIFRLGFVWADTQLGRYDELQRGYRMLKSCLLSGFGIKNYRYQSPPTPVDYAARSVVFLANRHSGGKGIFHISSSGGMIEGMFERCNEIAGTSLKLLPFYEWVCEVKRLHHEGRSLPIVPLIESSFSMDENAFYDHQRHIQSANVVFDCARTHSELENVGILAPVLNDDLLRACIGSMLSRDAECRDLIDAKSNQIFTKRRVS